MKTYLKILLSAATFCLAASFSQAKDEIIAPESLPAGASSFIRQYFPNAKVTLAKKDKEWFAHTFDVTLSDGTDLEFTSNGDWVQVEMRGQNTVPENLLPAGIKDYVKKNFPGSAVKEIQKKGYGNKVELTKDIELRFNKEGLFTRIDD